MSELFIKERKRLRKIAERLAHSNLLSASESVLLAERIIRQDVGLRTGMYVEDDGTVKDHLGRVIVFRSDAIDTSQQPVEEPREYRPVPSAEAR